MNRFVLDQLSYDLIGNVPSVRQSAIKGGLSGVVLFLVFEYAGFVTGQLPRLPVAWLMMVATLMVESVLLFRIVRLLREPRRCDFNYIARLNYTNRLETASFAVGKAHRSFIGFTGAVLAAAALLEAVLIHERSVMTLLVVPGASMLFMVGAGVVCRLMIVHRVIPCAHHDNTGPSHIGGAGLFRRQLRRGTVRLSSLLSGWVHGEVRLVVRRNLLYLLRGELALSIFISIVAPVIIAVLLLMIGNAAVPFITAIPLAAAFMMTYHFASELEEAAQALTECFWYDTPSRSLFIGNYYTLLMPLLPLLIITIVFMTPALLSIAGGVRLINFLVAFAATVAIGCRGVRSGRSGDADPLVGLMLFAVIMVGNFIPHVGAVFSLGAVGIVWLLDGGANAGAR